MGPSNTKRDRISPRKQHLASSRSNTHRQTSNKRHVDFQGKK
jgi:hypothetical protein